MQFGEEPVAIKSVCCLHLVSSFSTVMAEDVIHNPISPMSGAYSFKNS